MTEIKVTTSVTGSKRFNAGKPQLSQLDPQFLLALADLMTASATKYGEFNYASGQELRTPLDSMSRHLLAYLSGENNDKESLRNHMLHIAANAMIVYRSQIIAEEQPELGLDNRHKWNMKD